MVFDRVVICPHCHRSIEEQDRYTMSVTPRDPGEPLVPRWARWALLLLLFLGVIATLAVFHIN